MDNNAFKHNKTEQQAGPKNRFWYIWGPLIIKWIISFVIAFIGMAALMTVYANAHPEIMQTLSDNSESYMELYNEIYPQYLNIETLMEGITGLFTLPVMLLWYRGYKKHTSVPFTALGKGGILPCLASVLMAVTASFGINNLILIGNLSDYSDAYVETMQAFYSAPIILQILSLGVLTPMVEELVFRGLLYRRIREENPMVMSILMSAVVFGIIHTNLVQMICAFILGMMLAYCFERTGTIMVPILMHIGINLFSILASNYQLFDWLMTDIVRIGAATVLCAAISSSMYVFLKNSELVEEE